MKILVLNGSPKKDRSDCLRLAKAFLKGMNEEAEIVHVNSLNIKPCLGCYTCWWKTPGVCCQRDDMTEVLAKIKASDLVIFCMPLYNFGMPSQTKALADRILPLVTNEQVEVEDGTTYHPMRSESNTRFMLISGCGFPNVKGNFEPLLMEFGMMFGEGYPRITCPEAPLLNNPEAAPLADAYLAQVEQAGREFAADGAISAEMQAKLEAPMLDPKEYRRYCSMS